MLARILRFGLIVLKGVIFVASLRAQSLDWQTLEGCVFREGPHSDGDSVEVEHGGTRYVFRLYFVDTIEDSSREASRRAGQAAAFGITGPGAEARALELAHAASDFTARSLREPFTVVTCWQKVDTSNGNPSFRAFVRTASGEDLALRLVQEGLAIIRGGKRATADFPQGPTADQILRDLRRAETEARLAGRGAWKTATQPTVRNYNGEPLPAAVTVDLRALAGREVRVTGRVSGISSLPDGRITFINFEGNSRGDFVAIIRSGSLSAVERGFPGGLAASLTGRTIEVRGAITLYRDAPQIEIEDPAQIRLAR